MNTTKAIDLLIHHNRWRRGEDAMLKQTDPKQFGIAIEHAVAVMEAAQKLLGVSGHHEKVMAYKGLEAAMEGEP